MTVRDAAARWGVSPQRVRVWCSNGRVDGAVRHDSPRGPYWAIPEDSKPPTPLPPGKKPQ